MAPFDITQIALPARPHDRFQANIAALQLLRELEQSGQPATAAQREVLARFSAFGDSQSLDKLFWFDPRARRYVLRSPYQDFLTEQEGIALRQAALTAFYTPLDVISAMWGAAEQLGLNTLAEPRILEPSAGIGHIISAMPHDLRRRAKTEAVELDPVTGRMLGHLHPDITLHAGVGFQEVPFRENSFDLIISNVPFGAGRVHDRHIPPELCSTIHDYFFAKAMQLLRPGGLIIFLTSWGTMDKTSTTVRSWLAEQAVLLGAWRLPNGVFESTSGSASAADLLILQKRPAATPARPLAWLELAEARYQRLDGGGNLTFGSCYHHAKPGEDLYEVPVRVNQLWVHEPERVIGEPLIHAQKNGLYLQVYNDAGSGQLGRALCAQMLPNLPTNVITSEIPAIAVEQATRQENALHARPIRVDLTTVVAAQQERAQGLLTIYTAAKTLIKLEVEDAPAATLAVARAQLNSVYDSFVTQFGVIHHASNLRLAQDAPELAFLQALEDQVQEHKGRQGTARWTAQKARIFFERTINARRAPTAGSLSPVDAVLACLDETGELRMDRVARLCGMDPDQAVAALGDLLFQVPGTHRYELADAYLSGDVRTKLEQARIWAEAEPARYARNVAALEAVQPVPLPPSDITVNLSAFWVPDEDMTEFIRSLLPRFLGRATYNQGRSEWLIIDPDHAGAASVEAATKWGTPRANAIDILNASMRGQSVVVYDFEWRDGKEKRLINPSETVAAQEKQELIQAEFARWIWADPARSERLCALYNERFNRTRLRVYDGRHLSFPGMNRTMLRGGDLADYQRAAVWQVLQSLTTLIAFDVGGGKTFTAVASAIEAKRMGMVQKPLVVAPNNLVGQWASEARRLYPGSRVLGMAAEDFAKKRRGTALSRIATGDWDLIIIGETSLKFLPLDPQTLKRFIDRETDRLRSFLEELRATAKDRDEQRSLKQIEKSIMALEQRLQELESRIQRDSTRTIGWRELGIDMLIVDEAHSFKNLQVFTKMTRVAGLPTGKSQKALDMRIKTWDLIERGGKVVFLTATPIMNTLGEAYVMQLYLQERQLEELGITHFDEWVSLFAQPRMSFEMKPDGSGFRMTNRLDTFVNFVEMSDLWRQVMCVRTKAQMNLPEPRLVTGKVIPVTVPASPALKRIIAQLAERAEAIRNGWVEPDVDNMLKVVHDGRYAALDPRLIIPGAPRPRHSKIMELVKRVARLYREFNPVRGTQIVFCDIATPKGKEERKNAQPVDDETEDLEAQAGAETQEEQRAQNFVYHEIRSELVERGIPREEIAFIHEYTTKEQRLALFAAMNDGRVRVLLGSTGKMGVGMNVQKRLIALHNLDCPWRPGDLAQRHGRIVRQGNLFPEVFIFTYVTEGSFDGYMWQAIESKSRFISQALAGEVSARVVKDTDEMVLTAAEVKAIASGNPLVVEKVKLEMELARQRQVRASWSDSRIRLDWQQGRVEKRNAEIDTEISQLEELHAYAEQHPNDPFQVTLATQLGTSASRVFTKRADAGLHLLTLVQQYKAAVELSRKVITATLGRYRGFDIQFETIFTAPGYEIRLIHPATETVVNTITVKTELGVWSSADMAIGALPERIARLGQERQDGIAQLATIASERERLAVWEGQAAYDKLEAKLAEIDAIFAAQEAEAQAAREAARTAAAAPATANPQEAAEATTTEAHNGASAATPAPGAPAQRAELSATLIRDVLAMLHAEAAGEDEPDQPVEIPEASEALAWMAAFLATLATPATPASPSAEDAEASAAPAAVEEGVPANAGPLCEAAPVEALELAATSQQPDASLVEAEGEQVAAPNTDALDNACAPAADAAVEDTRPATQPATSAGAPTTHPVWGSTPAPARRPTRARQEPPAPGQLTLW